MRFYRSKRSVWTGTQADAREAQGGKDYEEIEVPTDKPGLLAFLNTFDVRPGDKPPAVAVTIPSAEQMGLTPEQVEVLMRSGGGGQVIHMPTPAPAPGHPDDCPACLRSQRVAKVSANSTAALSIKADLEDVSDVRSLNEIIRLAEARLREVTAPSAPAPAPSPPARARERVRTPA